MDIVEAIRTRKSIRSYKPDPVPKEVLREILDISKRTASSVNTQPWFFTVVTGEVLDNIRKGNVERLRAGETLESDHPLVHYKGIYKQRQVELAKQLFSLMDIRIEDEEKYANWVERAFRFFDAPVAIIVSQEKSVEQFMTHFDLGAIVSVICLTALNYGLSTCIESAGIMFPEVVRKLTPIPDSQYIVMGIAIGYPDWDFPANKIETNREPLENFVTWCGFD